LSGGSSASHHLDENADIPCRIADLPVPPA
jgi:hypothetical protein